MEERVGREGMKEGESKERGRRREDVQRVLVGVYICTHKYEGIGLFMAQKGRKNLIICIMNLDFNECTLMNFHSRYMYVTA